MSDLTAREYAELKETYEAGMQDARHMTAGYEAAVQREMLAMARKAAELRELLDTALDMLVVLAGITRDRRTRDAVLGEVEAMRAAADAIQSRGERN